MKTLLKKLARMIPPVRAITDGRDALRLANHELVSDIEQLRTAERLSAEAANELRRIQGFVSPGHFYSPIPDFEAAAAVAQKVFDSAGRSIPGIDLREQQQLELVQSFVPFCQAMDFTAEKRPGIRYHYENPAYSYSDAIMLHCMIRSLQPARIIEIGSGYSSCMMLDTNEVHFDDGIDLTFIEPYPELLVSLLEDTDLNQIRILPQPLQEIDVEEFRKLTANDILFIDSTHVSRTGSDVNRIFFDILPTLAEGVCVHFHDIFFPFEYPPEWLKEGRAWNEAYLLKAFLQFNQDFEIILMNTFLHRNHRSFFEANMPLTLNNTGGSIWLRRTKRSGNDE